METLDEMQKEFRDKMSKLDDFRNIEYEKRTTEDRKERDILLYELEELRSDIDDLKRYNELAALDTPDPDDLEPDMSGAC